MRFTTDHRLERFILRTQWDDLPEDVQERTIWCSVDQMGAQILGSRSRQYSVGMKLAGWLGLAGDIPVWGGKRFNLLGASIAFSHGANSYDIDDGYNLVKGHPGASFVGGVLAAALERNCSYEEYLTTLAVCYETAIRWGLAEQEHYGYLHSTGAYGAFGTAAGMGRLRGLDRAQLNNALSIADYHAPMTPVMRAVEYPSMNKDGVPFGSLVGTMAVLETEAGETGKTHLLEAPEGRKYIDTLGERYYIKELYFKPYTCCRWAHQPILACQKLMETYGFDYKDVAYVRVNTFEAAARLSKKTPADTEEAQYNIAFPVACALVHGDVGYMQVRDEAVGDPRVLEMMEKLEFTVDPKMDRQFSEKRLAWVEIALADGRTVRSEVCAAPGEHDDPALSREWITDKFRRVTSPLLSVAGQEDILKTLTASSAMPMREVAGRIGRYLT